MNPGKPGKKVWKSPGKSKSRKPRRKIKRQKGGTDFSDDCL
jgi:hypothetical protein